MTERWRATDIRTDRPEAAPLAGSLTVADLLALDPVRAGSPEVLAGQAGLDAHVRWVHVADSPTTPGFLEGGEVVLTTGAAWPSGAALATHTEELLDAGAVAVMVELGTRFAEPPVEVQQACERRGTPFVVLRREVSFVAITQAAHRLLVASQMSLLQASDEVQALFTELIRSGAPTDHIVAEVARLTGSPIVLEDLRHRVVSCALQGRGEAEVLEDWARRSRSGLHQSRWRVVDVVARGHRWGQLVAADVDPHAPVTDLVLALGALALSLDATAAPSEGRETWEAARQQRVVETVVRRRYTSGTDLLLALEAAGLRVREGPVVAVGWVVSRHGGTDTPGWIEHARDLAARVAGPLRVQVVSAPAPRVPGGMLGLLALPSDADATAAEGILDQFDERLRQGGLPLDLTVAGRSVMLTCADTHELEASVREASDLLETTGAVSTTLVRPRGTEIERLTRMIPQLPLQEFVEELIGPLLAYDARHGTDLLPVLATYLRHPGNRTRAARESHLSRSVFYQRLDLIESQLGRDLRDGSTLTALHLAVAAHGSTTRLT